jgi:ABC-type arginine transport system ATPase subunit
MIAQNLLSCPASSPYPGLRPFTKEEAEIFFGRDDQTDLLLEKLASVRFLMVVGSSGCGKSSLVRAGLMADLEGGLMREAGSHWEMAEMRPGIRGGICRPRSGLLR